MRSTHLWLDDMVKRPKPRLHLIQARDASVAVVFRRGPSKWVELVRWETDSDRFERGHWFHGRIYERRSDLSPDGERLVYFASKFTKRTLTDSDYTYAWTAVSKPPWLTAVALWPKGDCWHGGGLFRGPRRLFLNHQPDQAKAHRDHPPQEIEVIPNPEARGEDEPIYGERLSRDGWELTQEWDVKWEPQTMTFRTDQPEIRLKAHPHLPFSIRLERSVEGFDRRERFRVVGGSGGVHLPKGKLDWVDWDHRGRLIVLHAGGIDVSEVAADGAVDLRTLIDLSADEPESREAPTISGEVSG